MPKYKKLTNKQIETHLNQLYFYSERLHKLMTLYIEMKKDDKDFNEFVQEKYKEIQKTDK
tara:strand:- start:369 stop:548 length:180 start_codon:yes stop_codon:yes gene_type:complete